MLRVGPEVVSMTKTSLGYAVPKQILGAAPGALTLKSIPKAMVYRHNRVGNQGN
ncbi:predicted protein [Uncinocarpus reesii 1704]|uniref:Uncharacterized protein n=1 Tax=Uncinocarpus reesii (strain UAMH 1704) TaxID=336963 RepID=C4JJS0_UNCRE|nr:uncharacterized protein UREG_01877 [Uncinocarpus reesii 1704]EEP77028.1 predicted protein [Uncinocarpus reesii 1704]